MTGEYDPIERIWGLDVTASAARHRNVREARLTAMALEKSRERVIGTSNDFVDGRPTPKTELYGWASNVDSHADRTGFVYFMPLVLPRGGSLVFAGGKHAFLYLGSIYRLNDFEPHHTYEAGVVVAMFRGPYKSPADAEVIAEFASGLAALARGDLGAPRVKEGFRFRQAGECWAETPEGIRLVPLAEARSAGWIIATCASCSRLAFEVDNHFPYHWDGNACLRHAKTKGVSNA